MKVTKRKKQENIDTRSLVLLEIGHILDMEGNGCDIFVKGQKQKLVQRGHILNKKAQNGGFQYFLSAKGVISHAI